jgi:hypothetical protein
MKRALALVFLLVALSSRAKAQDEKPFKITEDSLGELLKELRPLVEKESGKQFSKAPTAELGTVASVKKMLVVELEPQMHVLLPDADDDDLADAAKQQASFLAKMFLGKYSPSSGKIVVLADNFPKIAELMKNPRMLSRDWARVTILHELVHALDQDAYKAFDDIKTRKTPDELEALNAVLEGHAQFVTHRILAGLQQEELFEAFKKQMLASPPETDEATKYMASVGTRALKFAYIDGEAFMEAVAKEGHASYVEDLFAKPPVSKSVIMKPATYYKPEPVVAAPSLKPLWKKLEKAHGDEWASQKVKLDESALDSAFGDLVDAERLRQSLNETRFDEVLILTSKTPPGAKQVTFMVWGGASKEAAGRFYDLEIELLKAKDKRMKTGPVAIKKADYGTLEIKDATRNTSAKKVVSLGSDKEITTHSLIFEAGARVVEMAYVGEDVSDEDLVKEAGVIMEFLAKTK